ncbi:sulfotransferase [Gammaproteobacteria bacterium]|nr:sulfotransferase [Gammaproteobacteria bacterium]
MSNPVMSSRLIESAETMFFCTGLPKSGTTFLQRMLNCHPEISCPSEHQFNSLRNGLSTIFGNYNNMLRQVGKRTGDQGVTIVDSECQLAVFRCTVETIIRGAADGKPIMGANDNGLLGNLALYDSLFGSPRILVIFRNPIDAGISAWHHNLRLAEEEGGGHKDHMMRYGGFEGWLRQSARWFNEAVDLYRKYAVEHDNIIHVRYEDLAAETAKHLERIVNFLGADSDPEVITKIVLQTKFDVMKKESSKTGFYRAAATGFGAGEVDDELRKELAAISSEAHEFLGYELVSRELL